MPDTSSSRRRLLPYLRGQWRIASLVMFSILMGSLMSLAGPYVWGILFVRGVIGEANLLLLPVVLLLLLLTDLGRNAFSFLHNYFAELLSQRFVYRLRVHLFTHLEGLSLRFYDERHTGELISRVTNDVNSLQSTISKVSMELIPDVVMLSGGLLALLYLDARSALMVAATFPAVIVISLFYKGKIRWASKNVQESVGGLASKIGETVSGIRIIQSFTRERQEAESFKAIAQKNLEANLQSQKLSSAYSTSIDLLTTAGTLIVIVNHTPAILAAGAVSSAAAIERLGVLIAYLGYLGLLYGPLRGLAKLHYTIQKGRAAADRIFEVLDATPEVKEDPSALELPRIQGTVEFEEVSFGYTSKPVLRRLTLSVKAGQKVALVGPSGVGKTTLVNLLLRFYDPWKGSIRVDSFDLKGVKLQSLRRQFGFVPQDPYLFSGTIRDNIAYGRPWATEDDVKNAARIANAHDFITQLPQGYETEVGERGVKLSVGQRQRISIARAIIRDPSILIFDEATSNLDSQSEELIKHSLDTAFGGRTVFIIAHRLATVVNADQIVVLWDGGVAEVGSHKELLAKRGKYAQIYHSQVSSLLETHEEPPFPLTE